MRALIVESDDPSATLAGLIEDARRWIMTARLRFPTFACLEPTFAAGRVIDPAVTRRALS